MLPRVAKGDLQAARSRVRRMHELVSDQEKRVAAFEAMGNPDLAAHAKTLLVIFRETLEAAERMVETHRRSLGAQDPE